MRLSAFQHVMIPASLLVGQALACLHVTGTIYVWPQKRISLIFNDNNVQTCSGSGDSSQTLDCPSGYWAWYYHPNGGAITKALEVQYQTPHGNFQFNLGTSSCASGGAQCNYDSWLYC